jgi:hypothetical protein
VAGLLIFTKNMETKKIMYRGRSIKFSESALADFRQCIQSLPFAKKLSVIRYPWNCRLKKHAYF